MGPPLPVPLAPPPRVQSTAAGQALAINTTTIAGIRTVALGGRLRFMVSGGGPLSKETQQFMNIVFCCPVGQGYGLTETCGCATMVWPNDPTYGRVGPACPAVEIRLVDWEDGNYFVDPARSDGKSDIPQGEIYLSGDMVSKGYFKNPSKTAEDYHWDGDK